MPKHTFEDMLGYVTEPSKFLTPETSAELAMVRWDILNEFSRQRAAFIRDHSQLPGAGEVFDLASPLKMLMPARDEPYAYGYHQLYGMLFGMIIAQLNSCIETSGRQYARRAAIDYVRHYAERFDGLRFA